jgi:hypothetical protein
LVIRKNHSFEMLVAAGLITGHHPVHRVGVVPSMSISATGTVWDVNDTLYPWNVFDLPGTVTVDRAAAGDAGKTVFVIGLDSNFLEVTEEITLTSPTGNASTTSFARVFDITLSNGPAQNVGDIDVIKDATVVARMRAERGQSASGIYTIPDGKTGYLMKGVAGCEASADGSGDVYFRPGGSASFRAIHSFEVEGSGGEYEYGFTFPVLLPARSDIDVRITTRANNGRYNAVFDILLIDDDNR